MEEGKISFWHPASLISTCFGLGKAPIVPGTFGSLGAIGILMLCVCSFGYISGNLVVENQELPYDLLARITFFVTASLLLTYFLVSVPLIRVYQRRKNLGDASEIVADEVVGQVIACAILYFSFAGFIYTPEMEITTLQIIYGLLACFITFRLFDILKPGPIGWLDRSVKGAWGVMLDDVLAGVFAGVVSSLIFLLF
jgi:phosphatidylglycerophosphatase A